MLHVESQEAGARRPGKALTANLYVLGFDRHALRQ